MEAWRNCKEKVERLNAKYNDFNEEDFTKEDFVPSCHSGCSQSSSSSEYTTDSEEGEEEEEEEEDSSKGGSEEDNPSEVASTLEEEEEEEEQMKPKGSTGSTPKSWIPRWFMETKTYCSPEIVSETFRYYANKCNIATNRRENRISRMGDISKLVVVFIW